MQSARVLINDIFCTSREKTLHKKNFIEDNESYLLNKPELYKAGRFYLFDKLKNT